MMCGPTTLPRQYWQSLLPGLSLRVTSKGVRTWMMFYPTSTVANGV